MRLSQCAQPRDEPHQEAAQLVDLHQALQWPVQSYSRNTSKQSTRTRIAGRGDSIRSLTQLVKMLQVLWPSEMSGPRTRNYGLESTHFLPRFGRSTMGIPWSVTPRPAISERPKETVSCQYFQWYGC